MAKNQIDPIDMFGIALVAVFGPMAIDAVSFNFNLFGGFSFTTVLWSGSGVSVNYAAVLALVGVGWIVGANFVLGDWDLDSLQWYQVVPLVIAVGIVPAYVLMPAVQDVFATYDPVTFVVALVQAGSGPLLSYEG